MDRSPPISRIRAWYQALRPRVFTATYVPMGLAGIVAHADGVFDAGVFLLALVGTLFLQSAANLINEYADHRRGADQLKQAGQGMIIKHKILEPAIVCVGAILATLAGCLIGLYLLAQSGPLLWLIGIGGVLVAITYTAGPFPLAYNGLGEVAVAVFMGPAIVVGAYYVMSPAVTDARIADLCLISLPVAFMVSAILHANNIRDMDADRAVNKRTLAVIFGIRFARAEFIFLVIGAYVSQAVVVAAGLMPPLTLLTLLTLPEALRLIKIFNASAAVPLLHQAQGRTAKLHGQIGLLLVAGWSLSLVLPGA
ncbi:MAG: 1,4-dihydroxy-2-naphthoate octaprenyltransferase [Chloroflexota bacterium]|nr:1,4-dihydroxy-2-naphthoate octaprenyltransferase [Chloroflexota bacterium]MDE2908446.1 1,4-dihydroxy-2-naphthoate octaprenyltransferase [Chloroflexota bacterium]